MKTNGDVPYHRLQDHTMNASANVLRFKGQLQIHLEMEPTRPVQHALRMLDRDLETVLGEKPLLNGGTNEQADLYIRYATALDEEIQLPEAYAFLFESDGSRGRMDIVGYDDLGIVYGILEFSRKFLGISPFWFWADQPVARREAVEIPCEAYHSTPSKVRFRGWFVNDEVCLIGWKEPYPPAREVWEPVFEALLRCGGNMVIPGTDLPRHGDHYEIAAEMGLWLTHHHAEPLGAEMFLRAYPGKQASYQKHPELFEALWAEAIEQQKDKNVVWVLSFRGQGDQPFWEQDPSFDTPLKRGAMIAQVVRKQYDMIRSVVRNPICSVALYGEIAELYKSGHIELPDDVIKVWADNGYGKMVSRRHGNLNQRVPSLPAASDQGKHGIYYHVTFHDLQASNHLTMFPGPAALLKQEVEEAFNTGAHEYVLLNCGNVRPHVYMLDVIRELWNTGSIDVSGHLRDFIGSYYSSFHADLAALVQSYSDAAIAYGPHDDDRAGDEYYHHPARKIIGHWLTGKGGQPLAQLQWAVGDAPFPEQVRRFEEKLASGIETWSAWLDRCDEIISRLGTEDRQRAQDHLRFHGAIHLSGCEGFYWLCRSYDAYRKEQYPQAFVHASQSVWSYRRGLDVLRASEHGKWERFYRADWLTNIESTINNVETLRRYLRMHGDSPDFFLWYKAYLMPETEKYIYLENTHRKPLSDDDLSLRLRDHFFGEGNE
ncbi:glycosyl hydrolase 115 family protein [Paenibacillus sp. FSL L8-0470]|uniref:glycosyl hydrolase 115 family protein n=1 Tax=unclassified Paenibacillus TaxID=185978 RepID=UPI0030F893AB